MPVLTNYKLVLISFVFVLSESLTKALQTMERMVNQTAEEETFHDYRYYEEESDFQRDDGKGQFLPLWKFQYGKAKRK